jgi:hypothetical protein
MLGYRCQGCLSFVPAPLGTSAGVTMHSAFASALMQVLWPRTRTNGMVNAAYPGYLPSCSVHNLQCMRVPRCARHTSSGLLAFHGTTMRSRDFTLGTSRHQESCHFNYQAAFWIIESLEQTSSELTLEDLELTKEYISYRYRLRSSNTYLPSP